MKRAVRLALMLLVTVPLLSALLLLLAGTVLAEDPTFVTRQSLSAVTSDTSSVAVGDLDGDGHLDLVVGNYVGRSMVYLNDKKGYFPPARYLSTDPGSDYTRSVAVGDLDSDGDLDIVAGRHGQSSIYLNDGAGNFPIERTFGPTSEWNYSVALGDMNGDGRLDIVAGNNGQNVVYLNDGTGQFPRDASYERKYGIASEWTSSVAVGYIDNDRDLDIVAGKSSGQSHVYLNDGAGNFTTGPQFGVDDTPKPILSVAIGDMNGDGYLDIVAGEAGGPSTVYLNNGSGYFPHEPDFEHSFGNASDKWVSVTAGDMDGDGNVDIVTGKYEQQSAVYLNNGLGDFLVSCNFGRTWDRTSAVAAADLDDDGDLDIVAGNTDQQSEVYTNSGAGHFSAESRFGSDGAFVYSMAVGDLNSDGYLDVVAGNYDRQNVVYLNDRQGAFAPAPFGPVANSTSAVVVGDMNRDGHLDIVVASNTQQNAVYLNDKTGKFPTPTVFGPVQGAARSLVVGDLDGDGYLDIVVGAQNELSVYLNDEQGHFPTGSTIGTGSNADPSDSRLVALGDMDNDGDLDIVAGRSPNFGTQSAVYLNDGSGNFPTGLGSERAFGPGADEIRSIAVGDMDGDGDLDIVVGNSGYYLQNVVFINDGSGNFTTSHNFGTGSDKTYSVAVGDMDGDRDLDIVVGNNGQQSAAYLNDGTGYFPASRDFGTGDETTFPVAVGDMDRDGDLDIVAGRSGQPSVVYLNGGSAGTRRLPNNPPRITVPRPVSPDANFQSTPFVLEASPITITYTLADPEGDPVRFVRAWYSRDGGGDWQPAIAATGTITTNLSPGLNAFLWDTVASGFFGQSDNVVFRLEAYADLRPQLNSVPGPYQHPYASATTFPFRVRGTQIRVYEDGPAPGNQLEGAIVYRLRKGDFRGAQPVGSGGVPFQTNKKGILQGLGELDAGDRLVALFPYTQTDIYTLYHTSASPTVDGLNAYTVTAGGVQTLTVSSANPLILFDLNLSLEWDARQDEQFLSQLKYDLQRASEFLYDWTNGQAALGQLTVYHDRQMWQDAHIRIYATNRLRPSATIGGIVSQVISETVPIPTSAVITYAPGQLYMGATWNRYGNAGSSMDEDWPRTLAHELGHYALYLEDNYLGRDEKGFLVPVDSCPSAMTDPYRDDYSEFHLDAGWLPACERTLSNLETGRSDWATLTKFYPGLSVTQNDGPRTLPIAVTRIKFIEPDTTAVTLKAPIFYLASEQGERVQPGNSARAFLFQDSWATDLGRPTLDQLLARGTRPGDRICLYELAKGRLGCETVRPGDAQLKLIDLSDWQPEITVSPVTSRTFTIDVTNVPADLPLRATLYPANVPASGSIVLVESGNGYRGTFNLDEPAFAGYAHIWLESAEPAREAVIDFTLGGNPGHVQSGGGHVQSGGGHVQSGGAPVMSADGQVILYASDVTRPGEWFYTLQATSVVPAVPPWATLVGRAYRLAVTDNAPDLTTSSLSFSYMGSEAPPGEEQWIKLYFWDGVTWDRLATTLDTYHNMASAPVQGPGVYALMSSIPIPLQGPGWNLFGWPVADPKPREVPTALQSINGHYKVVYGYRADDAHDPFDPWKMYDPDAPAYANDLPTLQFAQIYWINLKASAPDTLWVRGASAASASGAGVASVPEPPATFYGLVLAAPDFAPVEGMLVTARINGQACGQTRTQTFDERIVYAINVLAEGPGSSAGCGAPGRTVTFEVGPRSMATTATWENDRAHERSLSTVTGNAVHLPLITNGP